MPREMVFVLDCSGSMRGWPIAKAKEALRRCLKSLAPDDTFQIIRFSNNASALGRAPIPATRRNVAHGLRYADSLRGSGGTMMIEGIKAALDFPHDERRLRIVSFLTDGYIGNEAQIFAAVQKKLGASRIFSFGVGSSPNRHLLEGLARLGRGAVAYVTLQGDSTEVVDRFYERAAHPALTDVKIEWGKMAVKDVYPHRIRDLFAGRPILITGRFEGEGRNTITVKGRAGGEDVAYTIEVDLSAAAARHPGITSVWVRTKLRELSDIETQYASAELKEEITALSLTYGVQCKYTSFLAVDSLERTNGDHGVSVRQAVPVPVGVRYDTTVE
jgi:Ca-activated chloride channel family protein